MLSQNDIKVLDDFNVSSIKTAAIFTAVNHRYKQKMMKSRNVPDKVQVQVSELVK